MSDRDRRNSRDRQLADRDLDRSLPPRRTGGRIPTAELGARFRAKRRGTGKAARATPSQPIQLKRATAAKRSFTPVPTNGIAAAALGIPLEFREQQPQQDVHAAADKATAGPATKLPYADQLQRSFGQYDISGIAAFIGGPTEDALEGMGAEGFARGQQVALSKNASLHTVAHEVAHVIQQRAGVALPGGVGSDGDAHEQQADAIADKVVRGESVTKMLGPAAQNRPPAAPIQLKKNGKHAGGAASVAAAPALAAPITMSSDSLKISAMPGSTATAKLRIRAEENCRVSAKALGGGGLFSVKDPRKPVELEQGDVVEVEVAFSPRAKGDRRGELRFEITTGTSSVSLSQQISIELFGFGGTFESGKGEVRVEIAGDVGGIERAKPPEKARPPRKKPAKKEELEVVPVEVFDAGDYTADELGLRCLDKMVAAMTKLDGALEIFGTVVSSPSKNEAERTAAGALALSRVGELFIKIAAKPLLSTLPGGGALYETLKAGLKVGNDTRGAGKASSKAKAANLLKDFTSAYQEQVTDARAELEASRQEVKVAVRRDFAALESKAERDRRKLHLFAAGSRLDRALTGELSVASLFTRIVSQWMTHSNAAATDPNRLIVDLAKDWSLITGFLKGPSGDRCAEQLMELHKGSLNVRRLGLPIQIRWFKGGEKDKSRSYVSASLSPDGTLVSTSAFMIWKKELAQVQMIKNLKSKGVPPVTKLVGSKA